MSSKPTMLADKIDLKQAIHDYFAGDYTSFYLLFHPDLQQQGYKAKVPCTVHEDHDPSVDLVLSGDKAGSYYCQVCAQGRHVIEYYALQEGLSCKTQYAQVLQGIVNDFGVKVPTNGHAKQEIVATFDYYDESSALVYQAVRREPGKNGRAKDFQIRRPDGNGDWVWNAKGLELIPYRLDQLAETKSQGPVVIVEGGAKTDALWAMGIRATTNTFRIQCFGTKSINIYKYLRRRLQTPFRNGWIE